MFRCNLQMLALAVSFFAFMRITSAGDDATSADSATGSHILIIDANAFASASVCRDCCRRQCPCGDKCSAPCSDASECCFALTSDSCNCKKPRTPISVLHESSGVNPLSLELFRLRQQISPLMPADFCHEIVTYSLYETGSGPSNDELFLSTLDQLVQIAETCSSASLDGTVVQGPELITGRQAAFRGSGSDWQQPITRTTPFSDAIRHGSDSEVENRDGFGKNCESGQKCLVPVIVIDKALDYVPEIPSAICREIEDEVLAGGH